MSIERTYYCDGPDCGGEGGLKGGAEATVHARTAEPPPHLPASFLELRGDDAETAHFCSWDCLMKYAATHPPDELIPFADKGEAS